MTLSEKNRMREKRNVDMSIVHGMNLGYIPDIMQEAIDELISEFFEYRLPGLPSNADKDICAKIVNQKVIDSLSESNSQLMVSPDLHGLTNTIASVITDLTENYDEEAYKYIKENRNKTIDKLID